MPHKDLEKRKQYEREYRERNKEKIWKQRKNNLQYQDYQKKYAKEYRKHYDKMPHRKFIMTKSKAKKRHLEFSLTLEGYSGEIAKPCTYCNNLLGVTSGLDRMDNKKGYTADNVCSCCKICNRIKCEHLSFDEAKEVIQVVLKLRGLIL